MTKRIDKNNIEEEKFIWAHGFRGSVQGQLAPLLWAWGKAEYYGRKVWERKIAELMAAKKQGKGPGEEARDKI